MFDALSVGLFLAVFFPTLAIVIALLLFQLGYLRSIENSLKDIKAAVKPIAEFDSWVRQRGLQATLGERPAEHGSLPPDKARRRDELILIGKSVGLDPAQSQELKALLEENARNDFAQGVISTIAFALIFVGIVALIASLTRKPSV